MTTKSLTIIFVLTFLFISNLSFSAKRTYSEGAIQPEGLKIKIREFKTEGSDLIKVTFYINADKGITVSGESHLTYMGQKKYFRDNENIRKFWFKNAQISITYREGEAGGQDKRSVKLDYKVQGKDKKPKPSSQNVSFNLESKGAVPSR